MKLLFQTQGPFRIGGEWSDYTGYVRIESDGETMLATIAYYSSSRQDYPGAISLTLTYNGITKTIDKNPFGTGASVEFPYDDNVKTLHIEGMKIYYNGTTHEDGCDITWRMSMDTETPAVTITCPGARVTSSHPFSWTITDSQGRPTAAAGLMSYFFTPDATGWLSNAIIAGKREGPSINIYVPDPWVAGTLIYYRLYAAVYETADAGRDDYVALTEAISPIYVVSYERSPRAPFELQYKEPVVRAPLKVTWQYIEDSSYPATNGYQLERSINGGDFTLIYAGMSKSFTDTVPQGADKLAYRVRAVGRTNNSYYYTGETLDTVLSNMYVGVGGAVRLAAGMYIGENGAVKQVTPLVEVG